MDPEEALRRCRDLSEQLLAAEDVTVIASLGAELVEAFQGLDGWLSSGGFQPKSWDGSWKQMA